MKKYHAYLALGLLSLSIPTAYATSFVEALSKGKIHADLRYRYEHVDEDNGKDHANASTLRTRLGYETKLFHGFKIFGEIENTVNIGSRRADDFLDPVGEGTTNHSVVADAHDTELNQMYLYYEGFGTKTKIGRQRIILDNARFVGNVGWRQNEQTFDAISVLNESIGDVKVNYVFIDNVNRIFTDNSHNSRQANDFRMDSHLLNISYHGLGFGTATAYAYWLNFNNYSSRYDFSGLSSQTLGIRLHGKPGVGPGIKALYTFEYAHQTDHANNPNNFGLDYYLVELGTQYQLNKKSSVFGKIGYEILSGEDGIAFSTPLATLHAFNGWADKFLTTPPDGLDDLFYTLGAKMFGAKLTVVYHEFESQGGGLDYGQEWDVILAKKFLKDYTISVKYANYDAEDFSFDTEKIWLTLGAKFKL